MEQGSRSQTYDTRIMSQSRRRGRGRSSPWKVLLLVGANTVTIRRSGYLLVL